MRAGLICTLAGLLAAACASNPGPTRVTVGTPVGLIVVVPDPDKLPFDPRSARLQSATQQLTAIAGHPIAFQLDAALVSEWRSSLDDELIVTLENVANDLAALKKDNPEVFTWGAPLLQKIECRYTALSKTGTARFDAALHVLVVSEPARQNALVERGMVTRALDGAFEVTIDGRFVSAAPEQIAVADRAAYFEYLTRTRPGYGNLIVWQAKRKRTKPDEAEDLALYGDILLKVTRLFELVGRSDDALAQRLRAWLCSQLQYLANAYGSPSEVYRAAPPSGNWARAQIAIVRWLNATAPSFTSEEQLTVANLAFKKSGYCPSGPECNPPNPFPGFDRFAFGLGIENAWARAGHPVSKDHDVAFEAMDSVVCPHFIERKKRTRRRSCTPSWYLLSVDDEAGRKRLTDAIVGQNDPLFTEAVFANLKSAPPAAVIAMWHGLEAHPKEWQIATQVIVEELLDERAHSDGIINEANRLWRASPERRGTALYVLAWSKRGMIWHYGDHNWEEFPKRFGEPVSAAVFGGMLDQGPRGMALAPGMWPALGKGWSRADVVLPRLDRFLDSPQGPGSDDRDPLRTLKAIVDRLCAEGGAGDLAKLHIYFVRRSASHPQEASMLSNLVIDTAGRCPSLSSGS